MKTLKSYRLIPRLFLNIVKIFVNKKRIWLFFLAAGFLLAGCKTSHIIVAWKNPDKQRETYTKIAIAGIIKDNNDSLRIQVENLFAEEIRNLGYQAVPVSEEFTATDLIDLSEEETFKKLCDRGIDAIITVALIDMNKDNVDQPRRSYGYPNNYYYNRVWNYKNIQADLAGEDSIRHPSYFWESIFFDLSTLQAQCTIQTRPFKVIAEKRINRDFEKQIIGRMVKEKILIKKKIIEQSLKPF